MDPDASSNGGQERPADSGGERLAALGAAASSASGRPPLPQAAAAASRSSSLLLGHIPRKKRPLQLEEQHATSAATALVGVRNHSFGEPQQARESTLKPAPVAGSADSMSQQQSVKLPPKKKRWLAAAQASAEQQQQDRQSVETASTTASRHSESVEGAAGRMIAVRQSSPPRTRRRVEIISDESPVMVRIVTKGLNLSRHNRIRPRVAAGDSAPSRRLSKPKASKSGQRRAELPQDSGSQRRGSSGTDKSSSKSRSSLRAVHRPSYEDEDSDSADYYMTDDDEDRQMIALPPPAAKAGRVSSSGSKSKSRPATSNAAQASKSVLTNPATGLPLEENTAPPPCVLSSLWYSRECFWHIFVLERAVGWKTRPVLQLVQKRPPTQEEKQDVVDPVESTTIATSMNEVAGGSESDVIVYELPHEKAVQLQQKALTNSNFWVDPTHGTRRRMEVSRIDPEKCPAVLAMAAVEEEQLAAAEGRPVRFYLQAVAKTSASAGDSAHESEYQREEVVLIKWRGRSHFHCSWERESDLVRLDPSNNTARSKIRRFYQNQEQSLGLNWKQMLEEERETVAKIHSGGAPVLMTADDEADQGEEYFAPQCLEVERILACDENEMNMQVLAKQRAINIRTEQEALRYREQSEEDATKKEEPATEDPNKKATKAVRHLVEDVIDVKKKDAPWDPEDNVRYVVKWKSLPYSEITWEYWRDIKHDAVNEAEDFWFRQQPPTMDQVRKMTQKPHPHIRDFKKLQVSPTYGSSARERPVASLGLDMVQPAAEDDDVDAEQGFHLRSYQLEGVNWLLFNWYNRRSCILADEMGLGKTCQSICFLQELQTQQATQVRGPFLIVAPLSLVGQWKSELESWAPDMNVLLYHGSADARDFLVKQEFYYTDQFIPKKTAVQLKKQHVTKFHILITTYEVVLKDIAVLSKIRWEALIVDEAHRLKNSKARLYEELFSVPREYCVLLTGTPIANATEELWALLHFANPRIFSSKNKFLDKFGEMTDSKQVSELHSLLKPYLLRRVKEDVEKSLPPKEETILEVSLTPVQKTYYKAIYERNTSFLYKGAKPSNAPSLMNVMMELRKCCNHPYLVKGAEERILADAANKLNDSGNDVDVEIDYLRLFSEQLVKSSGKMVLIEKLLQKLFSGGHKVLIFSQMVRVLDLLEELLKHKKYKYERLDGSTSSSSRASAVDRFGRRSCQRFVMLLSTRAGGLGLNLTAADTVIIFDSDWNPQNDLQAMARAHRIGQTRAVRVYRLLTAKTYEMHMFHSASLKLGLERAVLSQNREQGDDSESDSNAKSKKRSDREAQAKEIDSLLKKGAYDVFRDDDDAEAEKFMETDIDQLLENRAKNVVYGASATTSLGSGLGSFSKASFVANTDEGDKDVDLDDPDFWSKAVGLEAPAEIPEEVAAMLDDGVKRNRKQVQQFDPYAEFAEAEQRKKDKIALEKLMEKEEKERIRYEKQQKKLKKKQLKEKLKREREEKEKEKLNKAGPPPVKKKKETKVEPKKVVVEKRPKPKKKKKDERLRALRRAENEDPVIERLKQAWEVPQRNRATAAALRFGFGRFCKLRSESNFTSLPLQDLELFLRSYVYQLTLQVSITLLAKLQDSESVDIRLLFREWLGIPCARELDWVCSSVHSVMNFHQEVENRRRFLRMPVILMEPAYLTDLRRGGAFRALRRIGILVRLNRFIEDSLDSVLASLGREELGMRGCATNDLSTLDVDLKSRFVTSEELALEISSGFRHLSLRPPASWWDRSCDVALILGTFVHGLGNYESMQNDADLPFGEKISLVADTDELCTTAGRCFRAATVAVRQVHDDALEAARIKAELEVQAAVAAAARAAAKREEDAAVLRKGGTEAEAVITEMPETQVEDAFEYDGTDSHFVTLPRIHKMVREAAADVFSASAQSSIPDSVKSEAESDLPDDGGGGFRRTRDVPNLSMPDARVLDYRLLRVLKAIEKGAYPDESRGLDPGDSNPDLWKKSDDVLTNLQVRRQVLGSFLGSNVQDFLSEYEGVGLGASQCGTTHRTLNDGSDFAFGSASPQLAHVAYGTDAPRYLRAIGVPINYTRFAVSGLVNAESSCVEKLLETERLRFYGKEQNQVEYGSEGRTKADGVVSKQSDQKKAGDNGDLGDVKDESKSSMPVSGTDAADSPGDPASMVSPVDPVALIPDVFRENAKLRAYVCLAVLLYGFPSLEESSGSVNPDLWRLVSSRRSDSQEADGKPEALFTTEAFRQRVMSLADDVDVPDAETLRQYVESTLLPHCLLLCVNGNGPTTRTARGSHGIYETAFGVSIHPEPSESHPSPLPDPCLSLHEHSLEALSQANAILRRVRLLRTCAHICTGKHVPVESLDSLTRSKVMGSELAGLPVWWCPWIHDPALLIQAATCGLFSIVDDDRSDHRVFSPKALQKYLYSTFISAEDERRTNAAFLAVTKHTTPEQIGAWTEQHAKAFPTLNQLERRLAWLCAQATMGIENGQVRYDHLPMFDHGGWPRN